jgi:hypothetical protein
MEGFSASATQDANETLAQQAKALRGKKTKNETGFASRTFGKKHQDRLHLDWRSPNAQDWR